MDEKGGLQARAIVLWARIHNKPKKPKDAYVHKCCFLG